MRFFPVLAAALIASCGAPLAADVECGPAADRFFEIVPAVAKAAEIVEGQRIDWNGITIRTEGERAAYARARTALDDFVLALEFWVEAAETANGFAALCRLDGTLDAGGITALDEATRAGRGTVIAGRPYLEAVAAIPD